MSDAEFEPYGKPKVGDEVYHIDELEKACVGRVRLVEEFAFEVTWYDGVTDDWNVQDHPDILKLKEKA